MRNSLHEENWLSNKWHSFSFSEYAVYFILFSCMQIGMWNNVCDTCMRICVGVQCTDVACFLLHWILVSLALNISQIECLRFNLIFTPKRLCTCTRYTLLRRRLVSEICCGRNGVIYSVRLRHPTIIINFTPYHVTWGESLSYTRHTMLLSFSTHRALEMCN